MNLYEKKYKEALELARVAAFNGHQSLMEGTFPELAESKDEKISKEIIKYLEQTVPHHHHDEVLKSKEWIAWLENIPYTIDHEKREGFHLGYKAGLEKQGEQSSLNINRECLKGIKRVQEYQDLSDWEKEFDNIASMYAHNKNQEGYNDSWYVKERAAEMLYYAKKELEKQGGQKPQRIISAEAKEAMYDKPACAWSEEDDKMCQETIDWFEKKCFPYALENDNPARESIKWLKSLKDRVIPQPKSTWSEEDQNALEDVRESVVHYWGGDTQDILLYWLKSIKQKIKGE